MSHQWRDESADELTTGLRQQMEFYKNDLTAAFMDRDWAQVAKLYRTIAGICDRLEEVDPRSATKLADWLPEEMP